MTVIEKRFWTEGIKEGEKREQERIIKLLEELDLWGNIDTAFVPELIELIEGEQK